MWCRQRSDNNNVRVGYYDSAHTEKIEMVRPSKTRTSKKISSLLRVN